MIDITAEQPITMREAARLYGSSRGGRPTHVSTIVRHIVRGTRLRTGEVVRLEGGRIGGKWITTRESIQRYVERLTRAALSETQATEAPIVRPSDRRYKEPARTDRKLDEIFGPALPGGSTRPSRAKPPKRRTATAAKGGSR
jgi:hypothetical protein